MALELFNQRTRSMALLMWSGISETQGDMWFVPPTWMGHPSLTQSSEEPFIATAVTNFNSIFCNSIKGASSAITYKIRAYFQLRCCSHQCCPSNFQFPPPRNMVVLYVLTPFMMGGHVTSQKTLNRRDVYVNSRPEHSVTDLRPSRSLWYDNLAVYKVMTAPPASGPFNPRWTCSGSK